LFARLYAAQPEGTFHLSTTMYARHRQEVLQAIRERLKQGQPCRVVSTSLVEAGVDLDFDAVFREAAGLDSILQAAGRCNREGNRLAAESPVTVFTGTEDRPPPVIRQNIDAYRQIERRVEDLAGLDAVRAYFEQLYYDRGPERLDEKGILARSNQGASAASFPFADLDRDFTLIDNSAQRTVYVLHRAPELEKRLRHDEKRSRELFRALQPYAVSLYQNDFAALDALGAIMRPDRDDPNVLILYKKYYHEQTGVILSPEGGQADFA
jgi:CRISPR-associated endonuclease/helicase Cas3